MHVEPILVALPDAGRRGVERALHRVRVRIAGVRIERGPLLGETCELLERVLAAQRVDLLDQRGAAGPPRGTPFVLGPAFGLEALLLRERRPHRTRGRFEARDRVRVELESRLGRERRPLGFRRFQFRRGVCRVRRQCFDACHQARHFLLPRFEREPLRGLGFVQCLHHCPGPLCDRLVLRSRRHRFEGVAQPAGVVRLRPRVRARRFPHPCVPSSARR